MLDEHGAPAMGAEVVLRAAEGFGRTRLVSGEDGSFKMFPAPGAYRIKAKWSAKENGAPGQPIDILHGGPTDVTLRLPPRRDYRFRGHVVDENKDPLADVAVRVDGIREVLTDDDGSFEMTGLQDATVNVSLDSNDGAHAFHRELDISDDRQHKFIVTTTVEVCGVVEGLDPTGTYSVQGLRFSAVDPSFCVPGIAQGSQTLVAHQGTRSASVKIQVTPSPSRVTFRLTPSSGPLNGHVVDSEGLSVLGTVWLTGPDGEFIRSTNTDASGAFSFARVPAGPITLLFRRPSQTTGRTSWPRIELDLPPSTGKDGVVIVAPKSE